MWRNVALVRRGSACELEQRWLPEPDPGRAIARVLRAGVCGTDLQIQRRIRPDAAAILGHEGLAEVWHPLDAGSRWIIFNPVDPAKQERVLGHSFDGIFQQLVLVDLTGPGVVAVDPRIVADLAPLIEPLAAVLYGWELVGDQPLSVAIWGGGTTAVLSAVVAELQGIRTYLLHHRSERRKFLIERNILSTTLLRDSRPDEKVEAAFICVPREAASQALTEAVSAIVPGGVIDLFGGFAPGDRHPLVSSVDLGEVRRANACGKPQPGFVARSRGIGLTGHRGTSQRHLREAQELLLTYPDRFAPLVTHVISLEQASTDLPSLSMRGCPSNLPSERIKVIIDPTMQGYSYRNVDLYTTVGGLG